ncbi:MAG: response regulator [Terriglobales bacterium]
MRSILLVEDSRFMRIATERTLTRAGYTVISISDGEEALRAAAEQVPDLVLLDMLLPKLGGQKVLQALKSNTATAHIPVIVLSSLPQANEEKLKEEGAIAYFEKSKLLVGDSSDLLVKAIERVLRGKGLRPTSSM